MKGEIFRLIASVSIIVTKKKGQVERFYSVFKPVTEVNEVLSKFCFSFCFSEVKLLLIKTLLQLSKFLQLFLCCYNSEVRALLQLSFAEYLKTLSDFSVL